MNYPTKRKVLAYITRQKAGKIQLLIFRHKDYPEAGFQVPAGTVEQGEDLLAAIKREVLEESGLLHLRNIRFLGEQAFIAKTKKELHQRCFFQMEALELIADAFEHTVTGNGEDENLVFIYQWYNLNDLPVLMAEQDEFLDEISNYERRDS